MTDLELMELLEAEGYEPDVENLLLLKEGLETGEIYLEARSNIKNAKELDDLKSSEDKARYLAYRAGHNYEPGDDFWNRQSKLDGRAFKRFAIKQSGEIPEDTGNHKNKKRDRAVSAMERKLVTNESYSDYDLYQILESNGYTTTEANLSILKEGIESGKYIIE